MHLDSTISLHGHLWKKTDIQDQVQWALTRDWTFKKWFPQPALIHKSGGTISRYTGQKFDPAKIDLIQEGWSHDHCEICFWTLHLTDDSESGSGYFDGYTGWLCSECFSKFIQKAEQDAAANP